MKFRNDGDSTDLLRYDDKASSISERNVSDNCTFIHHKAEKDDDIYSLILPDDSFDESFEFNTTKMTVLNVTAM